MFRLIASGALFLAACSAGESSSADDAGAGSGDVAADVDAGADAPAVPACHEHTTGTWLVTRFEFLGANEDGTVDGFDLDDRVSTAADDGGCNKFDATASDGTPGIDNQLSELLPALEATGVSLDTLIGARIREGTLLLVAELDGEATACASLQFQRGDGDPLFDTTGTYLPFQTLDRYDGATQSATTSCDWVDACSLDASGDLLVIEFLFITQEIRIDLQSWRGSLELQSDGSLRGLIGGGVSLDSAMNIVTSLGGDGDQPIRDVIEPLLPRFADVFPDAEGDCSGISAAVRIEAVPIFLFDD